MSASNFALFPLLRYSAPARQWLVASVIALSGLVAAGTAGAAGLLLEVQRGPSITGPWTKVSEVTVDSPLPTEFFRVAASVPAPARDVEGYVWIPSGVFTMGTPDKEAQRRTSEGPQTVVRISEGFWMSRLETTQRQWSELMDSNTSSVRDPDLPVDSVSWDEALEYCAKLTTRERAAGRLPAGYIYRLPTEAEWEFACRAGSAGPFSFGDSLSSTNANFDGARPYGEAASGPSVGGTVRGGQYPANAWGLHDMHGNVWEWCLDWHPSRLSGGKVTDPVGSGSVRQRAMRGGAWHNEAMACRSGYRYLIGPIFRAFSSGLRPVVAKEL
jgi:formylglycine-generating enzyme required for sulfatase activity